MNVNSALDALETGESAIVLFTRGLHYQLYSVTGDGWSGYWKSKPEERLPINKVVIYDRTKGSAKVYVADYVRAEAASTLWAGRTIVHFRGARLLGTT